jgi:hypothetical protein
MMEISINCIVSMRYIMKNGRDEVLENTMQHDPVSYLHGAGGIHAMLQSQLEGLIAGSRKTVSLPATSGLTTEDFIFDVLIDQVRQASAEEILLGYPVTAVVEKCESDCDCYVGTTSNNAS